MKKGNNILTEVKMRTGCSRHDEVALLHSQGLAVNDIASEVGVSEPTVRKILSSAGDADGINQKNL